jgi:hypothetical protein
MTTAVQHVAKLASVADFGAGADEDTMKAGAVLNLARAIDWYEKEHGVTNGMLIRATFTQGVGSDKAGALDSMRVDADVEFVEDQP